MTRDECVEIAQAVRAWAEAGHPMAAAAEMCRLVNLASRAVEAEAERGGFSEEIEFALGEWRGAQW